MPNQKNVAQLEDIKQKLSKSKNVILANYAGLNVNTQVSLRAKVKEVGGEVNIAKNTLIKLALADKMTGDDQTLDEALNGPTAITYGYEDAVSATKALVDFAKDNEALVLKAGVMFDSDGAVDSVLTTDQIQALAKLPGRDELRAQLVGQLNAPIVGLVNVLQGNIRNLVYALEAVRKQKEAN